MDELGRRSYTTSIAYGPTIGKNIALAYLPWSHCQVGRKLNVEYFAETYPVVSMLSLIATFNSFDIIWILTQGGPNGDTTTMIIDTYRTAIGSKKYGEGAARAVLICIFLSIFCIAYFRVTHRLATGESR